MVNCAIVVYHHGMWDEHNNYIGYKMDAVSVDDSFDFLSFHECLTSHLHLSGSFGAINLFVNLETSSGLCKLVPLLDDKNVTWFFAILRSGSFDKCPIIVDQPILLTHSNQNESSLSSVGSFSIPCPDVLPPSFESIDFVDVNNMPASFSIRERMAFPNKNEVRKGLQVVSLRENFHFRTLRSNANHTVVSCAKPSCSWFVRASMYKNSSMWVVRKVVKTHSCPVDVKHKSHRQATSLLVSECVKHNLTLYGDEAITPKMIVKYMCDKFGVCISYKTAWRGKELAKDVIMGSPADSYAFIPLFSAGLYSSNPGSATALVIDENQRFKYFFLCGYCRPIISVDGTFLHNKFVGTLLTAATLDGNNQIFPLAFGIFYSENDASWEWFFLNLRLSFGCRNDLVIVSDRNISIANGIASVFPEVDHGLCIHHLLGNLKLRFKYFHFDCYFYMCAKAYTLDDYEKFMSKIDSTIPGFRTYVEDVGLHKWAQCHFKRKRYLMLTNNCSESLNSRLKKPRGLPVVNICESIRQLLQEWFYDRRLASQSLTSSLTNFAETFVNEQIDLGRSMIVIPSNSDEFQVFDSSQQFIVNFSTWSCTCKIWDVVAIPCSHACAAISKCCKHVHNFTALYYSTSFLVSSYIEVVHPIPSSSSSSIEVCTDCVLPPVVRRPAGRPKKNRIASSSELKHHVKCSRCGKLGHNIRTCKDPLP